MTSETSRRRPNILLITSDQQVTSIHLCGNTNKQRPSFERRFGELVTRLDQDDSLKDRKKKKRRG